MRVLFITRKYPPQIGGMESFSFGLINNIDCEKDTIILNKSQINLIWWLPYALIAALFKAKKVDCVHLCDGLLAPIGLLLKKFIKKKVTITVHGLDVTWPNFLYQKICVNSLKYLDKIICVSNSTKQDCLDKNIPEKKLVVIPNGIDINKFKIDSKFEIRNSKFILLTVGRLVKRKGVEWFIRKVITQLHNDIEYWVVGTGPEQENIKKVIRENDLQDKVKLLGFVPDKRLKELYQQADVFVMPNIKVKGDREGFGIVALEAAACGLPVVASNIEGIKEAVANGKNGYLIEPANAVDFIMKINELLVFITPELKKKIQKYTVEKFSFSRISKAYLYIFSHI